MAIHLEKLLPVFVFPLGVALALCLIVLGLSIARRHFASRIMLAIVILGLWAASMPSFAGLVTATLEPARGQMSIYLEKLPPVFVFPLGLALAPCLVALACRWRTAIARRGSCWPWSSSASGSRRCPRSPA
jgi:hypothetical protein